MQKWAWALLKPGGHTPPDAEPPCPKVMLSHEVPFWWTVEARKSTTPQTPQLHIDSFSIEPPVAHARLSAILHGIRTSLSLPITHYPASFPSLPPVWILGVLFSTPCFLTLSQTLLSWELSPLTRKRVRICRTQRRNETTLGNLKGPQQEKREYCGVQCGVSMAFSKW